MPRQLNVRSDKAYETARRLAEHYDTTTTKVVEEALDEYAARRMLPSTKVTKEQAAVFLEELDRLIEAARPFRKPGATSDHSDMYDENGLPI